MQHKVFCKSKRNHFGKPKDEQYYEEYKQEILQVMKEHNLEDLPILYNLNFTILNRSLFYLTVQWQKLIVRMDLLYFGEWCGIKENFK